MSKIFQLEGGQYEHPNEYKLVSTTRGTTILQPEFGTVIIEGDVIEASTHNTIQKNGVLASKVNVTRESTDTVLVPTDMTIELDLFNELKIMLLFKTGTTLPSNSFIKLKDTNIPIANVNDYVVNANTPLLFLYFDSKFYAYKAGEGASTATETTAGISKIATQTEVDTGTDDTKIVTSKKLKARLDTLLTSIGTNFVKLTQLATETIKGISQLATQIEVDAGVEDTKIVTSKKLKARLDSMLASITTNFVKLTQLATESIAGIIKISTTAQVSAGTDNTTAVSPAKLFEVFINSKATNGYQKLPGGLIVQWGQVSYIAPSNTPGDITKVNVTFPVAFTTKLLSINFAGFYVSGSSSDDGLECIHTCESSTNTSMVFRATRLVGSASAGAYGDSYWIAIGY